MTTKLLTKLENSNYDKPLKLKMLQTQKLQLLPNSEKRILTELKRSYCDKTQKLNLSRNKKRKKKKEKKIKSSPNLKIKL